MGFSGQERTYVNKGEVGRKNHFIFFFQTNDKTIKNLHDIRKTYPTFTSVRTGRNRFALMSLPFSYQHVVLYLLATLNLNFTY